MHYECELAVVIGADGRRSVKRDDAMSHVAGYTVANDYAIRDYLENWYRPNLRGQEPRRLHRARPLVRRRADMCPTRMRSICARSSTARSRRRGNTRDLVNDVPALIEYLSSFMTLSPAT